MLLLNISHESNCYDTGEGMVDDAIWTSILQFKEDDFSAVPTQSVMIWLMLINMHETVNVSYTLVKGYMYCASLPSM